MHSIINTSIGKQTTDRIRDLINFYDNRRASTRNTFRTPSPAKNIMPSNALREEDTPPMDTGGRRHLIVSVLPPPPPVPSLYLSLSPLPPTRLVEPVIFAG